MSRYDKETELIAQGEMFAHLLDNDVYERGVAEAKQRLFDLFQDTDEQAQDEREDIYNVLKALQAIEHTMEAVAAESEMIAEERERDYR